MKATEQYFHVVLLIMLHNVVLTFEFGCYPKMKQIQMKATILFFYCRIKCVHELIRIEMATSDWFFSGPNFAILYFIDFIVPLPKWRKLGVEELKHYAEG